MLSIGFTRHVKQLALLFFKSSPEDMLIDFRKREREGERKR